MYFDPFTLLCNEIKRITFLDLTRTFTIGVEFAGWKESAPYPRIAGVHIAHITLGLQLN